MSTADELALRERAEAPAVALRVRRLGEQPGASGAAVTAEDALSFEQARLLSGRRGARLVAILGETGTGKTALAAMLWQEFLEHDRVAGHRLAGSSTVHGFERRAHWARAAANQRHADFPATTVHDAGLLHLRVRRPDSRRVELLLADLPGEHFERVRDGRPLRDELTWVGRADRFIVVLDAAALSTPGESGIAASRTRRLLLALRSAAVVRESARVALVITKCDQLTPSGAAALARHEPDLVAIARSCDPHALTVRTAAVALARHEREGLGELVTWLCGNDRPRTPMAVAEVPPERAIAAFVA
jgi:Double-GTPase 2